MPSSDNQCPRVRIDPRHQDSNSNVVGKGAPLTHRPIRARPPSSPRIRLSVHCVHSVSEPIPRCFASPLPGRGCTTRMQAGSALLVGNRHGAAGSLGCSRIPSKRRSSKSKRMSKAFATHSAHGGGRHSEGHLEYFFCGFLAEADGGSCEGKCGRCRLSARVSILLPFTWSDDGRPSSSDPRQRRQGLAPWPGQWGALRAPRQPHIANACVSGKSKFSELRCSRVFACFPLFR